jgi:hypothetical protein
LQRIRKISSPIHEFVRRLAQSEAAGVILFESSDEDKIKKLTDDSG